LDGWGLWFDGWFGFLAATQGEKRNTSEKGNRNPFFKNHIGHHLFGIANIPEQLPDQDIQHP
jgi:hypothetical protein